MKKWLSLLMALAMMFSLLPTWTLAEDDTAETGETRFVPGHIRVPQDFVYPTEDEVDYAAMDMATDPLPAKYDGRSMQSSVKDQAGNGLCWAFAACAAVEANLIKNGMGEQDFSEMHVGFASSIYQYNGSYVNQEQGFHWDGKGGENHDAIINGGCRIMSAAYMTRGSSMSGVVSEKSLPYVDYYDYNTGRYKTDKYPDPAKVSAAKRTYSVQDVIYLTGVNKPSSSEVDVIKRGIMAYGALDSSMHWPDGEYYGEPEKNYYNEKTSAFYYYGSGYANHEVLLVGWDDNYSRSKFVSGHQPKKNGAWLVKNSWSDEWGDDGYFWISYEDTQYPIETTAFSCACAWDANMHIYESDYRSWGKSCSVNSMAAKVFPIDSSAKTINSVRVFLPAGGSVTVEADVIKSFSSFSSYKFSAKGSRSVSYPGWYTIDLNTPVTLGSSGKFAVVIRLSGTSYIGYDDDSALGKTTAYLYNGSSFKSTTNNLDIKAICENRTASSTVSLKAYFSGSKLLTDVTNAPGALLIAASYDKATGRQADVKVFTVKGTVKGLNTGFTKNSSRTYRLMLVNAGTFAPLCAPQSPS